MIAAPPRQRDVSRALGGGHHGGGGGAEGEVVGVAGVRVAAAVVARHGPGVVLVGERACNSKLYSEGISISGFKPSNISS